MSTAVVVDTRHSPHARLRPVPVDAVRLTDRFWAPRQELNRRVMIPAQYRLCEETGRFDNLRKAAGLLPGESEGWYFNDTDVYKWLEAASWSLAWGPDPAVEAQMDAAIALVAAAQQSDGYLDSYFTGKRAGLRFTNFDLHELYCAGHLFQAAIAHRRVTGKTSLLAVAARLADHLCAYFGPHARHNAFDADGHPEVEMALVELYRLTGERRYLDLAAFFIGARGQKRMYKPIGFREPDYFQDHVPFRQLQRLEGHSVRAVYLNCGAADLYAETGEAALDAALERMWASMVQRQMYVHGGLGSRYETEGFGRDFELPNQRAHAETCASVANLMWNWRMFLLKGQARFVDLIERALFNGALAGVSLDGLEYYYQNPLSDDGCHRRERWFEVACCPANLARTLASLPGYVYSVSDEGLWVNLYVANRAEIPLPDGRNVSIEQQCDYPWSGEIDLHLDTPGKYSLFLRLPGWCTADQPQSWTLALNGQPCPAQLGAGGYLEIRRDWQAGDELRFSLPMPVRRLVCRPDVAENQGRVALMRGPLLYCVESADHPGLDARSLILPDEAELQPEPRPDLLGGVVALCGPAQIDPADEGWGTELYRPCAPAGAPRPVTLTAIPYYTWANRQAGPMQVWLRRA